MSIDDLLSQPLPAVADNGFSARVIAKVRAQNRRRVVLIAGGSSLAASVVTALLPLRVLTVELGDKLASLMMTAATSTALPIALGVLVLTFLIDRRYFRI